MEDKQNYQTSDKVETQPVKEKTTTLVKTTKKSNVQRTTELPEHIKNFPITTLEQAQEFATIIYQSNLAPAHFDTPKDAAVAIMYGKELGIGAMSALMNMFVIGGKVGIGIHLYTGKLIKENILYDIKEDYTPVYSYLAKHEVVYSESDYHQNKDDFQIITAKTPQTEYNVNKIQVIKKHIDYKTTIKFTRIHKIFGEVHKMEILMTVYFSEYQLMGVVKDTGSWAKQPRTMLRSRCLTTGARLIAPDLFANIYSDSELHDMNGTVYNVSEEGEVIDIV